MNTKQWVLYNLFSGKKIKSKLENIINYEYMSLILEETSFLKNNVSLHERLYCIVNDIKNKVCCENENCENYVNFNSYSKGYFTYCCNACVSKSKKVMKKTEETFLKKFGVKSVFLNKEIKEKIKETFQKKYGTCIIFQSKIVKDKIEKSHMERFGVKRASMSDVIKNKTEKTNMKKYGVRHTGQIEKSRKKRDETCIARYGFSVPTKNSLIKEKIINTKIKKYGSVSPHSTKHVLKNNLEKLNNLDWMKNKYINEKNSCSGIARETGVSPSYVRNKLLDFGVSIGYSKSSYENEITDFINIDNIIKNIRNIIPPYELDIYIPDYKLAVEFNGLYWHSKKSKNYHLNKTNLCKEKGIQLLHIFENEWADQKIRDIWKSIINNKLGRNNRIFARKTELKEINDNKLVKDFLNKNHLQGYCFSSKKLGLFYEDELVSLMTFGKTRFSKKYEWEMIRFCNKKFITIIGGASKLYKYFVTNYKPNSIISYADRRYSDGNLYKHLGFELSHYSNPNYWYFKLPDMTLNSRIKFQKHKLSSLLEVFENDKSEVENMENNGYMRVFDCGNIIYTWSN